jgi:hypothetical protein
MQTAFENWRPQRDCWFLEEFKPARKEMLADNIKTKP